MSKKIIASLIILAIVFSVISYNVGFTNGHQEGYSEGIIDVECPEEIIIQVETKPEEIITFWDVKKMEEINEQLNELNESLEETKIKLEESLEKEVEEEVDFSEQRWEAPEQPGKII